MRVASEQLDELEKIKEIEQHQQSNIEKTPPPAKDFKLELNLNFSKAIVIVVMFLMMFALPVFVVNYYNSAAPKTTAIAPASTNTGKVAGISTTNNSVISSSNLTPNNTGLGSILIFTGVIFIA